MNSSSKWERSDPASRILVAGLTPAWQRILCLPALLRGEVNRAGSAQACASGKGLNVALALHHLGAPVRTLTFAGGHDGEALRQDLASCDLSVDWIDTHTPTRVCTTLLEPDGTATELVENAGAVTSIELEGFAQAFSNLARDAGCLVLTGSLPDGAPKDYYLRLARSAPNRPLLLDARGPELEAVLPLGPLLVKPNRSELATTVGRPLNSNDDVWQAMTELRDRGPQWVLVTDGGRPARLLGPEGRWILTPPPVEAVNAIGCGDCLLAGLAWGWSRGLPLPEAARLGLAAAAENLRQLLPARLDPAAVEALAATIAVEQTGPN